MPDIPKQKKAVIDIGTNSIKLCVAESSNTPPGYLPIYDEIKITRLGEGLSEKNKLGALPSERSMQTIQRFAAKAREFGVSEIRAAGTAALRKAANAGSFCSKVKDTCGIDVEIISGEHEAQLSHSAAVFSAHERDCVVFDIGGGSTEFIYSRNNEICARISLNLGVMNIKEKYFPHEPAGNANKDSVGEACLEIADNLHQGGLAVPEPGALLIGIGGTITTMALVKLKLPKFLPDKVNGTALNTNDVKSQIDLYQNSTQEERVKIPGLCADRADIILAGACIVKTVMDSFNAKSVTVSTNGLRHAVLAEMFR